MRRGEFAIDSSFDEITERLAFRRQFSQQNPREQLRLHPAQVSPANVSTVTVRQSSSIDQCNDGSAAEMNVNCVSTTAAMKASAAAKHPQRTASQWVPLAS